ncbi:MAG: phosphatase PAP2 family protein [Anaerolineaceae bacterium]|nr:phosphatase PAP2 family protein [Anaerolineaceae bacterium]
MSELLTKIADFDKRISSLMRIDSQDSFWFKAAAFIAHTGDSWFWCGVLFVLWLFSSGEREKILAYWGGSIALTACFVFILKRVIARTRPEGDWGNVYRKTDPYSFPSGHSVRAGLILVLAVNTFHDPLLICLFSVWALLMILSRVATGVHYFLDVIAGFILGLLIGQGWVALQPWFYTHLPILFDKSRWFR